MAHVCMYVMFEGKVKMIKYFKITQYNKKQLEKRETEYFILKTTRIKLNL